jgi:hypothetical protein
VRQIGLQWCEDETTAPIETPQLLLDHHLKALRLPTMLREYDRVARQCAAEDLDYPSEVR